MRKETKGMEDSRIVEMYWDRDEEAIRQSEKKYGRYCGAIAHNILFNRADEDECLNDTWIGAWNSIPPQRPEKLGPYLGKITRNAALNMYEKKHAEKRGGGQTALALDELAEVIGKESDAEKQAALSDLTDSINGFLRHIEKDARVIFVQRYWYMYSVEEIAKFNGFSVSKVKMSLARTREKLRVHLEEEGYTV